MKPTKKNKTQLIYKLLMNIIFLLVYFFYSLNYLSSAYDKLEKNKEDLISETNIYKSLIKEWLSYEEFSKRLKKSTEKDTLTYKILSKIDKDFYNANIKNKTIDDFDTYLESKKLEIEKRNQWEVVLNRDKKIDKILPYYVDGIDIRENSITDFEFINYIETILAAFSLKTEDPIWINDIQKIEEEGNENKAYDSSLFYIPLSLHLVWNKKNVIDFINYLKNIWSISIDWDNLKIYSSNKIHKSLLWRWNIYEKQLVTVEKIQFTDYLDSSIKDRSKDISFLKFIQSWQGREKIWFDIDLRFYVRWISISNIKDKIKNVIWKYNALFKRVTIKFNEVSKKDFLRRWAEAFIIRNQVKAFKTNLYAKKDFFNKWIKKLMKDNNKIYDLYKEMLAYEKNFISIWKKLDLIDEQIKKLKNN